ncbi:MAG: LptF/LptG family permease [Bacteroidia bacterium]|nr:LptF/LptG family permease [Bacteroidia bacterium]
MKKLNLLVLKSFLGPFFLTFFIALFVLLMQFLWKYIDDLVGKGLEWHVVARLLLYSSVYLVPMALPLAILISSIMTFGNMGEHYELVAAKAAGISLSRMLRPLLLTAVLISCIAFLFSNNILPFMTLKQQSLLYDITHQKPALNIQPGVFYNGIDGYSIRVGKKHNKTNSLEDIMIYDHTALNGNVKVIIADSGTMNLAEDNSFLVVNLFRGSSYEELATGKPNDTHQKIESKFDEELIRFDLSSFKLTRTNEELFKENKQMLNVQQLTEAMDSLQLNLQSRKADYVRMYKPMLSYYRDSIEGQTVLAPVNALSDYEKAQQVTILNNALAHARSLQAMYNNNADEYDMRYDNINRYEIEWHRKFTLSIACFVLFLIGAPLGAIIRKGGLGVPIIVAIIFFLIFHVASITGEKMAKEGSATPISGMWAATAILLPIGLFLIYKATTDSSIFDSEVYGRVIDFFRKRFTRKQNAVI